VPIDDESAFRKSRTVAHAPGGITTSQDLRQAAQEAGAHGFVLKDDLLALRSAITLSARTHSRGPALNERRAAFFNLKSSSVVDRDAATTGGASLPTIVPDISSVRACLVMPKSQLKHRSSILSHLYSVTTAPLPRSHAR
jgi:hypothetical protein